MKIYSIPFCPFCYRVKLALHEKKIPNSFIEIEEIDLKNPPKDFIEINPNRTVPTLQIKGNDGFAESMIIVEYLNNLNTDTPNLFGNSNEEIAKNKVLIERISNEIIPCLLGCFYANGSEMKFRKSLQKLPMIFEKLESLLEKINSPFFGGNTINAVDICFAPFICYYLVANEFNTKIILPKSNTKAFKYFKNIQNHSYINELILSNEKFKNDTKEELIIETEGTKYIKSSSRNLIKDIEEEVKILNKRISSKCKGNRAILWATNKNEKGPYIETIVQFKNYDEAIQAIQVICDLQETSDHHSHFVLENFNQIKVEVCTHQPTWGVTAMDIAFAETLSDILK
ncbi:glutathione S-transferase N-terminal domain-containing protein [Silvanigrella sp.]|jgi:glutathione S-transferase|uniref:glutathione S-transferase N-terminal domain-containing protein n=1 Tax=Silvanigrella sp. TaxID=2024976 RepID=UPI0037C92679